MPKGLISIAALICEKVLIEQDAVLSAIRIVDLFTVSVDSAIPLDRQAAQFSLLLSMRFVPDDSTPHISDIKMLRPNGELQTLGEPRSIPLEVSKYPGVPAGSNTIVRLDVVPRQMGTHYLLVYVDGEEVTRVPFTLQSRQETPEIQKS